MGYSEDEKEERGITKYNKEMSIEKWYSNLVEDCHNIITEAVHISRWALVEGYHNLGKRILEEHNNFERNKIYGERIVQGLAESLNMSSRILWYSIQFVQKYPDLNTVPEGKNITWNKIITKYLPTSKEKPVNPEAMPYYLECPKCHYRWKP